MSRRRRGGHRWYTSKTRQRELKEIMAQPLPRSPLFDDPYGSRKEQLEVLESPLRPQDILEIAQRGECHLLRSWDANTRGIARKQTCTVRSVRASGARH